MEIINANHLPKDCTIVDFSDLHYGNVNCHREGIRKMVERIKNDPTCYCFNKGDSIDCIAPDDKRYSHMSVDWENSLFTAQAQAKAVSEDFMPIRDRILAWGDGNHEFKLANTYRAGVDIAEKLDVPFGGYLYVLDTPGFKIFAHHGYGNLPKGAKDPIQRKANRAAHLKRKLEGTGITDCYYMTIGHTHQEMIVPPSITDEVILYTEGDEIKEDRNHHTDQKSHYIPPAARWYVNSPSFLKLYSPPGSKAVGYGEIMMLEPPKLGWIEIEVKDHKIVNVKGVRV